MKKLSYLISLALIALALTGCGTTGACGGYQANYDNCCGTNSYTGNWY